MSGDPRPIFYYRDHCHLCEQMAAFLFRHWPQVAAALRWVEVDSDAGLAACYGRDVPVLTANGELVCQQLPDPAQLERYFGPPLIPV